MTPQNYQSKTDNYDKNDALARIVAMRIDELFCELEVRTHRSGNKCIGYCPVHGGDNFGALNLYPEGDTVPGIWKCRTHHCEKFFKKTILGFVRGVLSHRKYGWTKEGDKMVTFEETIKWLCDFIKQDINDIKIDKNEVERRQFAAQVNNLTKGGTRNDGVSRHTVKDNLQIPAGYYINRGYSPDVLARYDVGLCNKQGREMEGRVVVPIYDNNNMMIGCTGRSIYPQCKACKCYHNGTPCPAEHQKWLYSKWRNSKNFNTGSCLYNYWNAKKYIQETGVVILVEGPGDVWRLEEAGIHNSVALFGCELTDEQSILLESSGAMSVIILLDNDDAGREAIREIKATLSRFYNIHIPEINAKDIGEMSVDKVRQDIVPVIESIQLKNKSYAF